MVAPLTPPATSTTNRRSLAAIVALALVAATAFGASRLHDDEPQYPETWDARVTDLVDFVETTRGLEFDHPVSVYFLTEAEYTSVITGGPAYEPTDADRADADRQVAMLRALGVIEGDPDLLAANDTIADSGTLAFYDTDRDVVNVRGEQLTVGLRVTLVHELTHALQDQRFDIVEQVDGPDPEAASAARSVVEGDAVNVEQAYVAELSDEDRAEYESESGAAADDSASDLEEVPDFLTTAFAAPYYFGPSFMALFGSTADGSISPARVDGILDRPPLTMGRLFEPQSQLDEVAVASVPSPRPDDEAFDRSTLGTIVLFSMLASRIDPFVAMDATDGWRGDAYTAVEDADTGQMCVTAEFAMAGPDDATELGAALTTWSDLMPSEAGIEIDVEGDAVSLDSCDPGADADLATTTTYSDALIVPVLRIQLAYGQLLSGAEIDAALCVGEEVVRDLTIDEMTADELTPELEQKVGAATAAAMTACSP